MKKSVIAGILGLAAAAATTAYGAGAIYISNGFPFGAYNPVVWSPGVPVKSTDGVVLTLWYGEGVLNAPQLNYNAPLHWDTSSEADGLFGFYYSDPVNLPTWSLGETWTFQVRANSANPSTPFSAASELWQEKNGINSADGVPPGVPGYSQQSIGFVVPEPSAAALTALGIASLSLFRRKPSF